MSYPPGSPGYPPASPQAPQYSAGPQYNSVQEPPPAGPSKLPLYLSIAVVVLGLAVYLSSFGPLFTASGGDYYTPTLLSIGIVLSLAGALLQGAGLLPNQKDPIAVVATLSVLGFLLHILIVISVPSSVSIEWALYLILAFSLLQAIAAVGALLLDAGVITAPVPRPKYEQQQQQQYNPYGAGPSPYYGQPQQQPLHAPQPFQAPPAGPQQRPGYPPQYGGYPAAQSTVTYNQGNTPPVGQSGPPTPPTGFPAYGQPQPSATPTSVLSPQSPSSPSPQPSEDESAPPPS